VRDERLLTPEYRKDYLKLAFEKTTHAVRKLEGHIAAREEQIAAALKAAESWDWNRDSEPQLRRLLAILKGEKP